MDADDENSDERDDVYDDERGIPEPVAFYDEYGHREWERLERNLHGRLEFEGTVAYLERHLPPGGRVVDVGGAAGRYTVWLASRGYRVTLVDPSERQREIAREKVAERDLESAVEIEDGDVRDLQFDTGRFDAALCTGGPLSHVRDASERRTAAAELRRVTASGGAAFVSVMGLLNVLQILATNGRHLELLPDLAETGDFDADLLSEHDTRAGFTETHFFRVAELEELLEDAGFEVGTLAGLEGVASLHGDGAFADALADLDDEAVAGVRRVVERLLEDRAAADLSSHLLAVCTA